VKAKLEKAKQGVGADDSFRRLRMVGSILAVHSHGLSLAQIQAPDSCSNSYGWLVSLVPP